MTKKKSYQHVLIVVVICAIVGSFLSLYIQPLQRQHTEEYTGMSKDPTAIVISFTYIVAVVASLLIFSLIAHRSHNRRTAAITSLTVVFVPWLLFAYGLTRYTLHPFFIELLMPGLATGIIIYALLRMHKTAPGTSQRKRSSRKPKIDA